MKKIKNAAFESERENMHKGILSAVSHDLKTPLACVIASLEIYERTHQKITDEKKDALIKTALREAYRLDGFISNILDMAQFEQGMVKPLYRTYQMDSLIQDCLTMMGNRLQGCLLHVFAPTDPVHILTDPVLLSRAICILLDNAAKYCTSHIAIEIKYEKLGALITIHIRDNGPGIPPAQQERIFSKYTRLSKEDNQTAGTGLGLPICRKIMTLLGGTVTVANAETGTGAVFTLTLPE